MTLWTFPVTRRCAGVYGLCFSFPFTQCSLGIPFVQQGDRSGGSFRARNAHPLAANGASSRTLLALMTFSLSTTLQVVKAPDADEKLLALAELQVPHHVPCFSLLFSPASSVAGCLCAPHRTHLSTPLEMNSTSWCRQCQSLCSRTRPLR